MSYSKIGWTDSPSTTTPVNATNLNKMDNQIYTNTENIATNTTDITNTAANVAQLQKVMTITLSADSTTSTAGKIPFNKVFFDNTDGALTLNSNGIKIGAGVSQVIVTGQCFTQRNQQSGSYMWTRIEHNNTIVNYSIADYSGDYGCTIHTDTPLNVAENDIITMYKVVSYNTTVRKEPNTFLTVKIIK